MNPQLKEFEKWYDQNWSCIQRDYFEFLRISSISTDPAYKNEVLQAATWVEGYLKNIGFKTEKWETASYPVIFAASIADPDLPTLLIYHHYDVQPVDPLELWKSSPFEPQIREGKVYARGASDNKGQCFYTLTALKCLFEHFKKIPFNIKLFIEGEEESGSRGAFEVLKTHKAALKANEILVVDGGIPAPGVPAVTLGLRGMVAMELTCQNSSIDLHSGIHGGIAMNPNRALVELLSQLWDDQGKIAIPEFYNDVKMPSSQEVEIFDQTVDQKRLQEQFGIRAFQGEGGYSLWASNAIRPTLEINGISGGYAGAGFKTVIPSKSVAKLSCRLAPGQNPERVASQIETFLREKAPQGLEITFKFEHGGRAVRCSPDSKIANVAAEAFAEVFGKPCLKILCGASVPLVADLAETCEGQAAVIGVSLDSDDFHAPNEHFSLEQLKQGFLVMSSIFRRLIS